MQELTNLMKAVKSCNDVLEEDKDDFSDEYVRGAYENAISNYEFFVDAFKDFESLVKKMKKKGGLN